MGAVRIETPRLESGWKQGLAAVQAETGGRVQVQVVAENNHMKDGDPDPLEALIRGELEFYTQSGNGLASLVPALR